MIVKKIGALLLLSGFYWAGIAQPVKTVWLDELPIRTFSGGIPSVSVNTNGPGDSMMIAGNYFSRGIGTQSVSVLSFLLNGKATTFSATIGVDDKANPLLHFHFFVVGDRKVLFESKNRKLGDPAEKINIDLKGIRRLGLLVTLTEDVTQRAYSDWGDAQFTMVDGYIPQQIPNADEKYILTPKPGKVPHITTPKIFGVTPGNPFLFTVRATGERPMQFMADKLPAGLTIDPQSGIITGRIKEKGLYEVVLRAKNAAGTDTQKFRIQIGENICLTPPIGWNGWNSWARDIDREKVIASADAMVNMGLANHGWTYINIDDAWQGQRGGKFNAIQPNEKFPDFTGMIDYIHGKGLKLGLYSTPWIASYAGYTGASSNFANGAFTDSIKINKRANRYYGKYRFEKEDARQMADWGVDYLKYDWRLEVPSAERMSAALKASGRDIVYSLSNSAPFANVKEWSNISNLYRTGPDIRDSWLSLFVSAFTLDKWGPYGGPGHWNDPDMMILGNVTTGTDLHPTRLTPDEQYSHVSLFSLLAAPLLIGCPIEQLDPFTLNLLTNDEVIAVDQDPLGKPGRLLIRNDDVQVWVKPLEDGSYAVGIFNIDGFGKSPASYFRWGDEQPRAFKLDFAKIGLTGKWTIRDVWRQKNLGTYTGSFVTDIRHHGVVMIRLIPNIVVKK